MAPHNLKLRGEAPTAKGGNRTFTHMYIHVHCMLDLKCNLITEVDLNKLPKSATVVVPHCLSIAK